MDVGTALGLSTCLPVLSCIVCLVCNLPVCKPSVWLADPCPAKNTSMGGSRLYSSNYPDVTLIFASRMDSIAFAAALWLANSTNANPFCPTARTWPHGTPNHIKSKSSDSNDKVHTRGGGIVVVVWWGGRGGGGGEGGGGGGLVVVWWWRGGVWRWWWEGGVGKVLNHTSWNSHLPRKSLDQKCSPPLCPRT